MAGEPPIFIDDEIGEITPAELQALSDPEKIEVMKAWFRERFADPQEETPWVEGEYIFPWGGPFDAREELFDVFSGVVDDKLIEQLAHEYEMHSDKWAPTPRYQDGPDEDEDRPEAAPPLEIGSPEELEFRADILARVERVEALLAEKPKHSGLIGHNHPPDSIDKESDEWAEEISAATAQIKQELAKAAPDVPAVLHQNDATTSLRTRIRKALGRKFDLATDEMAKGLGKSLGSLPFWFGLYHLLSELGMAIEKWAHALGAWPF